MTEFDETQQLKRYRVRSAFVPHDLHSPIVGAVRGQLAGLTVAIKDIFDIKGYRTGFGSPDWNDAQEELPSLNAVSVQKLIDSGATIIGKTVCDEFCFSVTGANPFYGTPINPHAVDRLPGGSSSGSASATASGCCDFALGGDTGGSVRIPAALCGLYGIRPTYGRVDLTGATVMATSFDVGGWFANAPGVLRLVGGALLDQQKFPAEITSCVLAEDAFESADRDLSTMIQYMLTRMRPELPRPSTTRIAPHGLDHWRETFRVIQGYEFWDRHRSFLSSRAVRVSDGVQERIKFASGISALQSQQAREIMTEARKQIWGIALPGTVLILPTAPSIAPELDSSPDELDQFRTRVMRLTSISGLSGLPQVTIPIGSMRGAPVGLSFIGWSGSDEVLLDLACRISKYAGTVL